MVIRGEPKELSKYSKSITTSDEFLQTAMNMIK